jgi:hypothetical protein
LSKLQKYQLVIDKKGIFSASVLTQNNQAGLIRASCVGPQAFIEPCNARLAQSVEQWIENPRVPGSIPGPGTILK